MTALLRTQDALDLETAIREWQSQQSGRQSGGPAPEPDEKSAIARLTAALDTLFREIVLLLSDKGKFPRDIFISLDRSRSCFSLWSDGHGVASGTMDDKFQRSRKLRQAMMKTLSHLSSTLIDRLVPVAHISNPKTKGLCDQVGNILEEVNFSNATDDSSSDSTSEYSTADVHELAEDLKTDVDCLIELDQMIRDPATDPEPEMTEADVSLTLWSPYQLFADKIEHRFPGADAKLFSSLGMVNYQRYLRCQTERDTNQVHAEQAEQLAEVAEGSKFHDSGLGSSLNPMSSYAETIMTYKDGNRSIRIPPLPEQAKNGEPFSCIACGRSVTMTTNSQWKRHLYLDLQPYVCLDTLCQLSNSTFSNRANWLQHLALDHGMEPKWEQIKCPLCGDGTGPGKMAITTHLGRHLEEISLSALPAVPDSESDSETPGSDIDNIHKERPDSLGEWIDTLGVNPNALLPAESPASHEHHSKTTRAAHVHSIQIHNGKEEAFHRRMGEMNIAPKEAKREIEKVRAEAEEAAYRRVGAEQKAEEERGRLYAQGMTMIEEAAYKRIKAERAKENQSKAKLKPIGATRQAEKQARDELMAAAQERLLEINEALFRQAKDLKAAESRLRSEAESRAKAKEDGEDEGEARAKARAQFKEALVKASETLQLVGLRSSALVSQLGNGESEMEEYRESGKNGAVQDVSDILTQEQRAEISSMTSDQLDQVMRKRRNRRQEQIAMNDGQGNPEQMQNRPSDQMISHMARPEAEFKAMPRFEAAAEVAEEQRRPDAKSRAEAEKADRVRKVARVRLAPELKAAKSRRHAEAKARGKAEAEARVNLDTAVNSSDEEQAQEDIETTPVPNSPSNDVPETTHYTRPAALWRWRCPSCSSYDQDRRKGPMCSNCSYLVGDGDGSNLTLELNEAKNLKRQALAKLAAEEAEESARNMAEAAKLFLGNQKTLDSLAPKEALTKPMKTVATSMAMKRERAPQAEHQYKSQHTEQDPNGPFALDDPPKSPNLYSTNKEYTPENPLTILRAEFPSSTATDHWATADKDWLLSSSEPAKMQRSSNLERRAAQAPARALQSARTTLLSPKPRNIEGQLDLMEPIVNIDRHTARLKQRLNPVRSDNGPLPSSDPRHLSVPHTALPSIQPGNTALPPIQSGNTALPPIQLGVRHAALPSFKAVQPGSTDRGKSLYDPDADWTKITEPGERRRLSNRMAQRAFRRHTKERLADLEKRAGAAEVEVPGNPGPSSHDGHQGGQISIPSIMNDDPPISLPPISGKTSLQNQWMRQDDSVEGQDPQTDGESRHTETSQARQ